MMNFEAVSNPEELIGYLKDKANRLRHTHNDQQLYIYHYTKSKAVEGILQSKQWYMNSPQKMNDGLELIHLEDANVDNLFFCSFLEEDKENLAMWSMYSQPWEEGILIRIPIEKMKEWNNSNPSIYSADSKEHKAIKKLDNAQLTFHSVAYTNADSKEFGEQEILKCGDKDNMQFNDIHRYRELAGYIKDMAWSYEKEIRLRVDAPDIETYDAVMLDIPQDIIDSFHFVTGPRFAGNLLSIIRKIDPKFSSERITSSLFTGRLNWVYCDSCSKNRQERS
jgi:hypothetical protein